MTIHFLIFILLSDIPFTELAHWSGFNSPYYTEDHKEFQKQSRVWLNKHLKSDLEGLEQRGKYPKRKHYAKIGMVRFFCPQRSFVQFSNKGKNLVLPFLPKEGNYQKKQKLHKPQAQKLFLL